MATDIGHFDVYFRRVQVLTGGIPFPRVKDTAIGHHVLDGMRPCKPENASSIGFSDSLWEFTQRCWGGEIELRPGAEWLVKHLGEAAANWDKPMPPCVRVEDVISYHEETSDRCKSGTSTLYWYCPPSNGTGRRFGSATGSEANPGLFAPQSTPSTQSTEPPTEDPRKVVTEPCAELQPKSRAHAAT